MEGKGSRKMLLVVIDGAADRKIDSLGGKTPLEAARMPYLQRIAVKSVAGMMYTIGKGIAPESDSAVFSLLGYDVKKEYTGRGPLEAYGAGINLGKDELALRANFATVNAKREVLDRRAGRSISDSEARELEREINGIKIKGVRLLFKHTVGYRGVLVLSSNAFKLSASVSNADIGYAKKGSMSIALSKYSNKLPAVKPLNKDRASLETAKLLNEIVNIIIDKLSKSRINAERERKGLPQANALLLRDAGLGLPRVESFGKRYGLRAAFVTEMPVERGIARLLKMEEVKLKPIANVLSRYRSMARLAKGALAKNDFVYVHIKGPDEPGHNGDAAGKVKSLEQVDTFFRSLGRTSATMCVTADHATPCELKAHSSDPVPVIICNTHSPARPDGMRFSEEIGGKGSLGVLRGVELVKTIMRMAIK